jgi:hypothetical protein
MSLSIQIQSRLKFNLVPYLTGMVCLKVVMGGDGVVMVW